MIVTIMGKLQPGDKGKTDKQREKEIERCSFMDTGDILYQQVYDSKLNKSIFIENNKGELNRVDKFFYQNLEYKPHIGEELNKCVVQLATEPLSFTDTTTLIDEIKTHIHKYLDINPQYEQFAAWYVLLTWLYDRFNTIVYLRALGDTGCGKTRFLNVIGGLCYNTTKGSGAVSVAAIKRLTEKWKGTLIVDEGDFKDSDEKNELIKFFNLGFERDSPMINCDKNDPNKLEFYIPYCPKIIATRRSFTDKALEARCLTHIMKQTARTDIPYILPNNYYEEVLALKNKLLKFRMDWYHQINTTQVIDYNIDIEPRLKQATYAFASMFNDIPEAKKLFMRFLKDYQTELIDERASSFEGQIVNIFMDFVCEEEYQISTKMITETIQNDGYRKCTVASVGKVLKSLGFTNKVMKIDGASKRILLVSSRTFGELVKRYISDENKVTRLQKLQALLAPSLFFFTSAKVRQQQFEGSGGYRNEGVHHRAVTSVTAVTQNDKVTEVTEVTEEKIE